MNCIKYIMKVYLFTIFFTILSITNSFKIDHFEPIIGKWKLLYSDNNYFKNKNYCDLCIYPYNKTNQLSVKLKKYENDNIITFTKEIKCTIESTSYDLLDELSKILIKNDNEDSCNLVILTTKKFIKSVGIFEFPYFALNYNSGMNPKYIIKWKYDIVLQRLYIYIDQYKYVFERNYYDKLLNTEKSITTNVFLIFVR
jgi:hypothetical protein